MQRRRRDDSHDMYVIVCIAAVLADNSKSEGDRSVFTTAGIARSCIDKCSVLDIIDYTRFGTFEGLALRRRKLTKPRLSAGHQRRNDWNHAL